MAKTFVIDIPRSEVINIALSCESGTRIATYSSEAGTGFLVIRDRRFKDGETDRVIQFMFFPEKGIPKDPRYLPLKLIREMDNEAYEAHIKKEFEQMEIEE